MESHTDIDALMALLQLHVAQRFCGNILQANTSLRPKKANTAFHQIIDSFAILFGHHPGCDAAAATVQTTGLQITQLYICPSPIIPHDFNDNVKHWVDQFTSIRKERATAGAVSDLDGELSPSKRRFILYTYRMCYEAMRQRALDPIFGEWELLSSNLRVKAMSVSKITSELAEQLQQLLDLIQSFAASISSQPSMETDEDILAFHELCLTLYRVLDDKKMTDFIERYVYPQGVDRILVYLFLPKALSTLLSAPSEFPDPSSFTILDPSPGARQLSTTVTTAHMMERFGTVARIDWEYVVQLHRKLAPVTEDFGEVLRWDAEKSLVSTTGVVTAHPETTLIQHLLKESNPGMEGETYVACSRLPCYASVRYVDVVNWTAKPAVPFTMSTVNCDWCRLVEAEPWILPEGTSQVVSDTIKERFLRDLCRLVDHWKNNPIRGGTDDSDEEEE